MDLELSWCVIRFVGSEVDEKQPLSAKQSLLLYDTTGRSAARRRTDRLITATKRRDGIKKRGRWTSSKLMRFPDQLHSISDRSHRWIAEGEEERFRRAFGM